MKLYFSCYHIFSSSFFHTEPLQPWLQALIYDYVLHNQNCDSAKFRQQMFSALKKLLLLVRDSR